MIMLSEQKLTLNQAARRLGVNPSTTWRWALNGVRGVRLETYSVGVKRYTSVEALERFIAATTAAASNQAVPSDARTPNQLERAIDHVERELDRNGI